MPALDELMLAFEALGDNCEFGLVQRQAGAEPLGLLRFAGFFVPVEDRLQRLLRALDCGFEGLGRVETVRVEAAGAEGRREYLVHDSAFELLYHTFQAEGRIDPETLRALEAKKLGFLRRKFFNDLATGEKILVWKSNLSQAEDEIDQLAERLRRFGPNTLLWVAAADADHAAGTAEIGRAGLLKGYVERFAPYDDATDIAYDSWFAMCEKARRLWKPSGSAEDAGHPDLRGATANAIRGDQDGRALTQEAAYRDGYDAGSAARTFDARFDDARLRTAWISGWEAATGNRAVVLPLPTDPRIAISGSSASPFSMILRHAFDRALAGDGDLDDRILSIPGMSGKKFRLLLNNLVSSVANPQYLEVGVFQGATFCSAIWGNHVRATAIDNWSEYGGPANAFYKNLGEFWRPSASVTVLNSDFRTVDYARIGTFNIYFFDGPHQYQDQYDGARVIHAALEDPAILIVDDWNWEQVRSGTSNGLRDARVSIDYSIELRTTEDGTFPLTHSTESDWHNGVFLAVISKSK